MQVGWTGGGGHGCSLVSILRCKVHLRNVVLFRGLIWLLSSPCIGRLTLQASRILWPTQRVTCPQLSSKGPPKYSICICSFHAKPLAGFIGKAQNLNKQASGCSKVNPAAGVRSGAPAQHRLNSPPATTTGNSRCAAREKRQFTAASLVTMLAGCSATQLNQVWFTSAAFTEVSPAMTVAPMHFHTTSHSSRVRDCFGISSGFVLYWHATTNKVWRVGASFACSILACCVFRTLCFAISGDGEPVLRRAGRKFGLQVV